MEFHAGHECLLATRRSGAVRRGALPHYPDRTPAWGLDFPPGLDYIPYWDRPAYGGSRRGRPARSAFPAGRIPQFGLALRVSDWSAVPVRVLALSVRKPRRISVPDG